MDQTIFREYDIRGVVGEQLSDETVATVGCAIGTFLNRNGAHRIAVGYDARESSPRFREILTKSLNETGCDVVLIGMVPTPVLYHTVFTKPVDGGVMITGSHNPSNHNGFKVCLGRSALFGPQIQKIKEIALSRNFSKGAGSTEKHDVLDDYRRDLISRIDVGQRKLKTVIDAGNGMGGTTSVPIYRELGVDVVELFTKPDSNFPNHPPDPAVAENLADLIEAVKHSGADVGIAFDGDADRITVVDETGRIIWGDELMILFSRYVLASHPGATVIAEVKCSQNLFDDIEKHGGNPIMWKAGHSIIKAKMKETGAVLAGEMSGHIFFADSFYGFDDAAYAGARLLEILSKTEKPLSELLSDLPKKYSTPEIRILCPEEKKAFVIQKIVERFSPDHDVVTIDGARIKFDHGWGLVRPSNTQAIMVLRCEADTEQELQRIQHGLEEMVKEAVTS
jgi:phosphomannomutase/phosphoglucomutase